jgi:hypothetical protein
MAVVKPQRNHIRLGIQFCGGSDINFLRAKSFICRRADKPIKNGFSKTDPSHLIKRISEISENIESRSPLFAIAFSARVEEVAGDVIR